MGLTETQRHRERDRETGRETKTERDTDTERESERSIDRETDIECSDPKHHHIGPSERVDNQDITETSRK